MHLGLGAMDTDSFSITSLCFVIIIYYLGVSAWGLNVTVKALKVTMQSAVDNATSSEGSFSLFM